MCERKLSLKASGLQIALIMKLPRICDPLVDQNEARAEATEELLKVIPWARRVRIIGRDDLEACAATRRPFTPATGHRSAAFERPPTVTLRLDADRVSRAWRG